MDTPVDEKLIQDLNQPLQQARIGLIGGISMQHIRAAVARAVIDTLREMNQPNFQSPSARREAAKAILAKLETINV